MPQTSGSTIAIIGGGFSGTITAVHLVAPDAPGLGVELTGGNALVSRDGAPSSTLYM